MSTATQKVKLQASDGEEFEVDRQVAERSILIRNLLDDIPDASTSGEAIPIMNVCRTFPPSTFLFTNINHQGE